MADDNVINLTSAYIELEAVVEMGALAASATFLTPHGLVCIACGPSGRAMSVNGEPVPIEGL